MIFCIPVLPKAKASNWDDVVALFNGTLRSLQNQTSKDFSVVVGCHDRPELHGAYDFPVTFLQARWPVLPPEAGPYKDKGWKRELLAAEVKRRGGGYFMMLDADDLLHRDFVAHVLREKAPHGYIVEEGYGLDHRNRSVAEIPGAWPKPFHFYCGSCAVLALGPEELPEGVRRTPDGIFSRLKSHVHWKQVMLDAGRPLAPFPFRAAAYVLNHGENNHSRVNAGRDDKVEAMMRKGGAPIPDSFLQDFGLSAL
jgi:hypothetical protein